MKLTAAWAMSLKLDVISGTMDKAAKEAMRDTVVEIHRDAVRDSPYRTGTNRRSLAFEASGYTSKEGVVDHSKVEGAVYSTSGYGGFLEVGTQKIGARPYIEPAKDRYWPEYPGKVAEKLSKWR